MRKLILFFIIFIDITLISCNKSTENNPGPNAGGDYFECIINGPDFENYKYTVSSEEETIPAVYSKQNDITLVFTTIIEEDNLAYLVFSTDRPGSYPFASEADIDITENVSFINLYIKRGEQFYVLQSRTGQVEVEYVNTRGLTFNGGLANCRGTFSGSFIFADADGNEINYEISNGRFQLTGIY